ncbi:MAG: polysaccharide deacetylase family protein [Clostridia bacterium]|nr:polysaccharide deacetylase family protein [Clostridia bacterium]
MNTALLTIDDVASSNTPAIVDYLNEKGIRAILFATGENVERCYEEAIYAVKNGMIVGNHSYSHPHFSELTMAQCEDEIERCEDVLERLYRDAGVARTYRPFRFPYGDKGGDNRAALQAYFAAHGFDRVDDTHIDYPWWRESMLSTDIDCFWTFDFAEYNLCHDPQFTKETIWQRMHDTNPPQGAVLFAPGSRHILLLHAHDSTEEILPRYYQLFIDHLLENGIVFDEPSFL